MKKYLSTYGWQKSTKLPSPLTKGLLLTVILIATLLLTACGAAEPEAAAPAADEPTPTIESIPTAAPAAVETEEAEEVAEPEEPAAEPTEEVAEEVEEPAAAGETESTLENTLVLMGHQEVAGLSPDDAGPSVQFIVISQIHNGLLQMDELITIQPDLAESFEISDDGLTYTFNLNQGVLFHDGEEFTSEDVKYTFEYYGNPDNGAIIGSELAAIESIETPDDYTVVITLIEPNAAFLTTVATNFIVPAHYHSEVGQDVYRTAPIGTGPYQLVEWNAAESTLLRAFDDHFKGSPNIDFLRMDVVPEPSVRAIAMETGEADSSVWPLSPEDNIRLSQDPNFVTLRSPNAAVNHFPLNNQMPPLDDKVVRQAMMYAIDRQQVIDDVFSGAATIAHTNLSPALEFWFNDDVKKYEYDPEQAAALLDEAGWVLGEDGIREKDGEPLAFTITVITGDQTRRPEAEMVQQFLNEVGFDVTLEEAPVASILEGMRTGELQASLFNWTYGGGDGSGDPESSTTLLSDGGNNFSNFRNERVDELMIAGLAETDPDERKIMYDEIQAIIAEEVPFIYMMYWDAFNIFTSRVQGLPERALNGDRIYLNAYQWTLE